MENEGSRQTALSDEYLRTHTIGELKPLSEPIVLVDYDSQWPETFRNEAEKIGSALGRACGSWNTGIYFSSMPAGQANHRHRSRRG